VAADAIAERYRFGPFRPRYHGAVSEGALGAQDADLETDDLYERSGYAVGAAMRYLKLPPSAVVVVHDESISSPARYGQVGRQRRGT